MTSLLLPRGRRGFREKVAKQGPSWGCLTSTHCPLPSRPEHLTFWGRIISIPTLGPGGQVELIPFWAFGLGMGPDPEPTVPGLLSWEGIPSPRGALRRRQASREGDGKGQTW